MKKFFIIIIFISSLISCKKDSSLEPVKTKWLQHSKFIGENQYINQAYTNNGFFYFKTNNTFGVLDSNNQFKSIRINNVVTSLASISKNYYAEILIDRKKLVIRENNCIDFLPIMEFDIAQLDSLTNNSRLASVKINDFGEIILGVQTKINSPSTEIILYYSKIKNQNLGNYNSNFIELKFKKINLKISIFSAIYCVNNIFYIKETIDFNANFSKLFVFKNGSVISQFIPFDVVNSFHFINNKYTMVTNNLIYESENGLNYTLKYQGNNLSFENIKIYTVNNELYCIMDKKILYKIVMHKIDFEFIKINIDQLYGSKITSLNYMNGYFYISTLNGLFYKRIENI